MENKKKLNSMGGARPEDLDWELLGKDVEVVLRNGGVLRGRVVSTSNYWVKIESSSVALYINKPFIVYVRLLEPHTGLSPQATRG